MRTETKTQRADRLAAMTGDAYSFEAFGAGEWTRAIRFLIDMSYRDRDIEKIMRSKWTRWARDSYSPDGWTGTAEAVEHFVTEFAGRPGYLVSSL